MFKFLRYRQERDEAREASDRFYRENKILKKALKEINFIGSTKSPNGTVQRIKKVAKDALDNIGR